jgi:glycerol-3-phosphate acyltransferase PlsY
MTVGLYIAVAVLGYLLGSIPFGVLISRRAAGTDLRQVGSGKTGMTNVLRTAGKKAAALALVLDIAKGVLAVVFARLIFEKCGYYYPIAQALAALAAIAGHSWSVFLGFKGGRGVNTFIGGLLGMYWPAAVFGGGLMLIIGFSTKYMSLGSITGAVAAFIMLILLNVTQIDLLGLYPNFEYVVYAMFGSIFIYVMHRDNVARLMRGTERKIGEKAEANNPPQSLNSK